MFGVGPKFVLARYEMERCQYRLSRSPPADRFVGKGAILVLAWLGDTVADARMPEHRADWKRLTLSKK